MDYRPIPLERAFELARTGQYISVGELLKKLNQEGYDTRQIEGPSLQRQLKDLVQQSLHKGNAKRAVGSVAKRRGRRPAS